MSATIEQVRDELIKACHREMLWQARALAAEPKAALFDEMLEIMKRWQAGEEYDYLLTARDLLILSAEELTGKEPAE